MNLSRYDSTGMFIRLIFLTVSRNLGNQGRSFLNTYCLSRLRFLNAGFSTPYKTSMCFMISRTLVFKETASFVNAHRNVG